MGTVKAYAKTLQELQPFLALKADDVILDLGCGAGDLTYSLLRYTKNVIGIDLSRSALVNAKKAAEEVDFIVADAEKLPVRDESINRVFAFEVLEHLPNPDKAIEEIYRVLRRKGLLAMLQQYRLDDYAVMWHRFLHKVRLTKNPRCTLEIEHINQFKPEGWARLLRSYKFELTLRVPTSILPPIPVYYGLAAFFPKLRLLYFNIPVLRTIDRILCVSPAISSKLALAFIYLSKPLK